MNTIDKGTVEPAAQDEKRLLFFNYHEHQIHRYRIPTEPQDDFHEQSIIVTHFPNPYTRPDTLETHSTRIVRVPRVFNSRGARYPEFSIQLPGEEDAAIKDDDNGSYHQFLPKAEYNRQWYGSSSVSPLSLYLSDVEFREIVQGVNKLSKTAYESWSILNVVELVLDIFTLWLFMDLVMPISKHVGKGCFVSYFYDVLTSRQNLQRLEDYVEEVNSKLTARGVRIISPRRSGYLSVSFAN